MKIKRRKIKKENKDWQKIEIKKDISEIPEIIIELCEVNDKLVMNIETKQSVHFGFIAKK